MFWKIGELSSSFFLTSSSRETEKKNGFLFSHVPCVLSFVCVVVVVSVSVSVVFHSFSLSLFGNCTVTDSFVFISFSFLSLTLFIIF